MHKNILIIGASSAIAHECAREYARHGAALCITARSAEKLRVLQQDLLTCGASKVECIEFDAASVGTGASSDFLFKQAASQLGALDAVLVAYGSLPDQDACIASEELTLKEFHTNATSVIALCTNAALYFESTSRQAVSQPCIAVISSVAGERGRQSNYVYGAAKGAVTLFLQGLRNRLHGKGINVLTIKPGFVDTPMTAHLPKNALFASSRKVGRSIYNAMEKGRDVVYVPGFWSYIMFIIRHIPESLFKTLKL